MFPFPAAMVLLMSSERTPLFCCSAMNNLEHEVSKIDTHSGITIRYGLEVISLSPNSGGLVYMVAANGVLAKKNRLGKIKQVRMLRAWLWSSIWISTTRWSSPP